MISPEHVYRRPLTAADTPAPAAFRAVQVLDVLSRADCPRTLTETVVATGLPKSSVANLLTTLEMADMVRRTSGGWVVGYRALEIGQSVANGSDLITEFHAIVRQLSSLRHETTLLAIRDVDQILYVARHDGTQTMRVSGEIGLRMPAVVTGLGKAMLSAMPQDELDALLAQMPSLPRPTNSAHSTLGALRSDLSATRDRGYAIDFEQNTIGVSCMAIAIEGSSPQAAVSTTLLSQRVTPQLQERLVDELRSLAQGLAVFAR